MTDDREPPVPRPAPQYGEYATPQQQAAAMGREYVAPIPPPLRAPLPSAGLPDQPLPGLGHVVDRFATMVQLGIGLLSLFTTDWFHIAVNVNLGLAQAGVVTRIPTAVDRYGWVLLGANIVFLALTFVWAYATMRRGGWAFYIPVVGNFAFGLAVGVFAYAISR